MESIEFLATYRTTCKTSYAPFFLIDLLPQRFTAHVESEFDLERSKLFSSLSFKFNPHENKTLF